MVVATLPDFLRSPASQGLYEEIRNLPLRDGMRVIPPYDPTASRTQRGWSGDMAAKFNMSTAWTAATLAGWERSGRITIVREDKRFVGIRLPEDEQPAEVGRSLRDQVHDLMKREADDKGRVHKETDEMRRELGVSPHDFIKAVWDLQKQGIVTFRQTGSGSSANLINYRLRGYRTNVVAFDDAENPLTTKPWDICPDCHNTRKQHTLANDNTGLICPAPKEGSPLAARLAEEEKEKQAATGNGDSTVRSKPIVPQLNNYVECPDCGSTFADDMSLTMHRKAKHAPPPAPTILHPASVKRAVELGADREPIDWSKYPLLTEMVKRYHARLAAITALQMAGEDAMGQTLLDKEETLPKETREVIALLTALGYEG